jgi:hypothetical protein
VASSTTRTSHVIGRIEGLAHPLHQSLSPLTNDAVNRTRPVMGETKAPELTVCLRTNHPPAPYGRVERGHPQ